MCSRSEFFNPISYRSQSISPQTQEHCYILVLLPRRFSGCDRSRMLLQKWVFLVTLWVLIISHGSADSGEVLGYGMPSPTACVSDPCHPLPSPPPPFVSGYPSYGRSPPPPSPLSDYPSYGGPPPPRPVYGYPSYGTPPPPPLVSGYPSYGAPPPPPSPPPPPGQGCSAPRSPLLQCCLYSPPAPYEYLPNQNLSPPSALAPCWFSVMVLSLPFALVL